MKTSDSIFPRKTFCPSRLASVQADFYEFGAQAQRRFVADFHVWLLRQAMVPMAQSTMAMDVLRDVTLAFMRLARPMKSATNRWSELK